MKLKRAFETKTTISSDGYYSITQESCDGGESDVIYLSPEQMQAIISDMQNWLSVQDDWWPVVENGSAK